MALKSTKMTLDEPEPGVYRFVGSGFGHGLGLCQIGANGMARAGLSYRDILAHYYPGTRLAQLGSR
jgi:stage II sporulation protein D